MGKRIRVTPEGFSIALNKLASQFPAAVVEGMQAGGVRLAGPLIRKAARAADPAITTKTYPKSWTSANNPTGARVTSSDPDALFVEVGRAPGPVPFQPILDWVHEKRIVARSIREGAKGKPRQRDAKGKFTGDLKGEIDKAEREVAGAIWAHETEFGIKPRWVLRNAVEMLRTKLPGILRKAVKKAAEG